MKDVVGKVAVVTGAGQGIGRALVERFGAEGMKVVLADVVPDLVETTTGELVDQGLEVTGVVTDVTSLESVEALRDATLERYGTVHVVCNNAGIGSASEGQLWEHHVNDWRWSLDVNVMGVAHGTEKELVLAHKAAIDAHLKEVGIPVSYTNVFWGGRSEIKPSEILPGAYGEWCARNGLDVEAMRV